MKLPYYSKRKDMEPLNDAISRTVARSGYDRAAVIRIASFFLEHVADEVTRGRTVRIPSFGAFAPWLCETKAVKARHEHPCMKPVFAPARGFREQVRWTLPSRKGKEDIKRYRRNHSLSSGSTKTSSRVVAGMEAIRQSIDAQMYGRDWPEPRGDVR